MQPLRSFWNIRRAGQPKPPDAGAAQDLYPQQVRLAAEVQRRELNGDLFDHWHNLKPEKNQAAKHAIERKHRFFAMLALIWTFCGIGFLGFACWCIYHVLRAKRLIP